MFLFPYAMSLYCNFMFILIALEGKHDSIKSHFLLEMKLTLECDLHSFGIELVLILSGKMLLNNSEAKPQTMAD